MKLPLNLYCNVRKFMSTKILKISNLVTSTCEHLSQQNDIRKRQILLDSSTISSFPFCVLFVVWVEMSLHNFKSLIREKLLVLYGGRSKLRREVSESTYRYLDFCLVCSHNITRGKNLIKCRCGKFLTIVCIGKLIRFGFLRNVWLPQNRYLSSLVNSIYVVSNLAFYFSQDVRLSKDVATGSK